jgi:2-polyprenyl-3-methyl-5-hydroxy-6-metoxy-1,4-benzoquinol methylase
MRNTIAQAEQAKYETAWALDAYAAHSPGERCLPLFLAMSGAKGGSVLDAGCGSGKGAVALSAHGFRVTCCDLTADGLVPEARGFTFHDVLLWSDLKKATGFHDYVYCCDVLEHIPPTFTMLVIARLLETSRKGLFLSISTVPDQFGAWVGESLHHSVQPFVAWRDQIGEIGRIVEARDLLTSAVFWVVPR